MGELDPDEYRARIAGDSEESRFLARIPWILDVGRQDPRELARALAAEANEFADRATRFSLLTPLWQTDPGLLRETILSVRCQSYPHWELILVDDASPRRDHLKVAREWADRDPRIRIIELETNRGISGARNVAIAHATGDFLGVLDHDDLIHPRALGLFARWLAASPGANLLFSNEAKIDARSRKVRDFLSKPPFDPFTLLRINTPCHLTFLRRDLLDLAARDGEFFRSRFDGCEDHDLFLRVAVTGKVRAVHLPFFLYYWRRTASSTAAKLSAKPEVPGRRRAMLEELVPRFYPGSSFVLGETTRSLSSIKLTALEAHPRPSLLVVIEGDGARARASLGRQEHDLNLRVVGAGDWREEPGIDLLLFLDGAVELESKDALQTMALHLLADRGCGAVGLRLMGPDGSVRHAGFQVWPRLVGGHFACEAAAGRFDFSGEERACLAVSSACLMTRRSTFGALGGFDSDAFPGEGRDLDFCLRAQRAGFRVDYFGTLEAAYQGPSLATSDGPALALLDSRHADLLEAWRFGGLRLSPRPLWTAGVVGPWGLPIRATSPGIDRLRSRLKSWARRLRGS
ncbi:MAG: glycosyltransferase [Isosphaeraceae bacterium]